MSTGTVNPDIGSKTSSLTRSIFPGDYAAADEGSYYSAWLGATANTAVAVTTQALGTTSPHMIVYNQNPAGGYNIYMRSIKLRITTATTGITSVYHVGVLTPTAPTTLGTILNGPLNVNSSSGTTSRAAIYGGVNVAPTPGATARIVHTGPVVGIIPIVLDSWIFAFGEPVAAGNMLQEAVTTTKIITVSIPPVIIAPQWYYTFGLWGPSWAASAPSYTYDVSFIERPSGQ